MAETQGDTAFGDALIEALEEAVAYESGQLPGVRVDRVDITARHGGAMPPPDYTSDEIRVIRRRLSLSQPVFAAMLNVSPSTVRAWEQGTRAPDGPTRRLLQVADLHPEALTEAVYGRGPVKYRAQVRPLKVAEQRRPWGIPRDDDSQ